MCHNLPGRPLKGDQGHLMFSPCVESQGCHLIPLYYHLACSSFESCYYWPILQTFSQKILQYFLLREAFLYGPCLAARRSKLVGGMCSMLPYGTGICCYTFIYIYIFFFFNYCFCPFLFILFINLVLINGRNGPRYQRVLGLCAF